MWLQNASQTQDKWLQFSEFWESIKSKTTGRCTFTIFWVILKQQKLLFYFDNNTSQPIFQRRINVVSTLWINVDPTLKMKQNPTSDFQRCTTLIQRQCPTLKQRQNNVDTTFFQPNVDVS